MDEDSTKNLPIDRSLAEMILARLDSIETKIDSMDARLTKIEEQNERRAIETKPIRERALSEIMEIKEKVIEVNERVGKIERQMTVLSKDVIEVRAEQFRLDNRIDKMESNPS